MRILIWATHLQTDILSLALHLDACSDVELLVVAKNTASYSRSPIARALPFVAEIMDAADPHCLEKCLDFRADVVVADNHLPPEGLAPRFAYMWHGLGWKARGRADLQTFYRGVTKLTGKDPRDINPRFLAQCYGPTDRRWRIENWGLHPDSCPVIGMTFSDLLLNPPYTREDLASQYSIDVVGSPTVLLSLTWHYGGLFARKATRLQTLRKFLPFGRKESHDDELAFLSNVFRVVQERGGNVLFCLHERSRYERCLLEALHTLANRHGGVEVRHKDDHPDNLADLLVSDAMMTNLSSFITYFYLFGKPSIHVAPTNVSDPGRVMLARLRMSAVAYRRAGGNDPLWMNDPRDNGGALVDSADSARAALERAFEEPDFHKERARNFLNRHVYGVDGGTAARFKRHLEELANRS